MQPEVSRQWVTALAFLDAKLKARREVLAAEVTRCRHVRAKWGYLAYCQGMVEGIDTARQIAEQALDQIESQRRVTKDNGS